MNVCLEQMLGTAAKEEVEMPVAINIPAATIHVLYLFIICFMIIVRFKVFLFTEQRCTTSWDTTTQNRLTANKPG